MDLINIIAFVFTLVGTIITIVQSVKATRAKNAAQKIKDDLEKLSLSYELNSIRTKIKNSIDNMLKYSGKNKEGLDLQNDLLKVKNLINEIASNHKMYTIVGIEDNIEKLRKITNKNINNNTVNEIIKILTDISRIFDEQIKK